MSNYSKATNFATKDTLTTGNPSKIVKGTELDAEFNAIVTAIASKLDTPVGGTAVSVIQIVSVNLDTSFSTTSTSYISTGHTATITPTSTSSKIYVVLSSNLANDSTNKNSILSITRGGSSLSGGGTTNFADVLSSAGNTYTNVAVNYLDSPATTASTTYTVTVAAQTGSTAIYNSGGSISTAGRAVLTLVEVL